MDLDPQLIPEIVQRVRSVNQPERIILFGSAALGKMTPDSDVDLLILENVPGNVRQECARIRRALSGLGHPFDIVIMSPERFEESRDVFGGLAYPADKYGRVIYEAP